MWVGVNTWVWSSPLTNAGLRELLPRIAAWGFDVAELPVENPGDWSPELAATLLRDLGLGASVCLVMPPGRELVATDGATVRITQDYLRQVIDVAVTVGAPAIAGPAYSSVGRTWRMDDAERVARYAELRESLGPVVSYAAEGGVAVGVEPLNRYETSMLNTISQTLTALEGLPAEHCGVAVDIYHQNIEETDIGAAIRAAAGRITHVQVSGNDRGSPGNDHLDWRSFLTALSDAGYGGPLCIESFTGDNAAIATAASIWRPLAPTQAALALDGLTFLRALTTDMA